VQFNIFKSWHGREVLSAPSGQAYARPDPELTIRRAVQRVDIAATGDGVCMEVLKAVAIVTEKTALRADPKETIMVLMQGKDGEIGQALLGAVRLESPMLRLRPQGTEQPNRTEHPDARPHRNSYGLSAETAWGFSSVRTPPSEGDPLAINAKPSYSRADGLAFTKTWDKLHWCEFLLKR
jgi:hypothetical protein